MVIEDRPGTDLDWILSSHATPSSRSCSIGTVISCSTSSADRPSASIWTCTVVGPNSGSVSTSAWRSDQTPKAMITTAAATTARGALRLDPTIQRIMGGDLPGRVGRCLSETTAS